MKAIQQIIDRQEAEALHPEVVLVVVLADLVVPEEVQLHLPCPEEEDEVKQGVWKLSKKALILRHELNFVFYFIQQFNMFPKYACCIYLDACVYDVFRETLQWSLIRLMYCLVKGCIVVEDFFIY